MGGVIDENGQQWEKCNSCLQFVAIQDLEYEQPSEEFKYGRDLCWGCFSGEKSPEQISADIAEYERWQKEEGQKLIDEVRAQLEGKPLMTKDCGGGISISEWVNPSEVEERQKLGWQLVGSK